MKILKSIVRRLLGEHLAGAIDYIRYSGHPADGPFNSQPLRQQLFLTLMERLKPTAIVETGTFRGTTTAFMADTGIPVFTVDSSARCLGYAWMRLWRRRNVAMVHGDSREALASWFAGDLRRLDGRTVFFYLDAHWTADLPLEEEIALVFQCCPNAVVMIDDFLVPHDDGYGYDAYGPGKVLKADYIAGAVKSFGLSQFYPSTPSAFEGGAKRGSIVLARAGAHGDVLSSIPLLRVA